MPELPEGTADFWHRALASRSGVSETLFKALCRLVALLPENIRSCSHNAVLDRKNLEKILTKSSSGLSERENSRFRNIAGQILRLAARRYNWSNLPSPALSARFHREPSCFRPDRFLMLHTAREIQRAVIELPCSNDNMIETGRVLLSAILFGGLVDKAWLNPWFEALMAGRVFCHGRTLWLELEKTAHEPDGKPDLKTIKKIHKKRYLDYRSTEIIRRRWFADPVTSILICRYFPLLKGLKYRIDENLWQGIQQFLKESGLGKLEPGALMAMGAISLHINTPANLASYASGSVVAVSLPETVWARLISGRIVPRSRKEESDGWFKTADPSYTKILSLPPAPTTSLGIQQEILRKTRSMLGARKSISPRRPDLIRKITERLHTEPLSQTNRLVHAWAIELLTSHSNNKPSTVLRYLGAIASRLIAVSEEGEFSEQEPSWYQDRYERIIGSIHSEKERSYALRVLGFFHCFLVINLFAPDLGKGVFTSRRGPPESTVDANLVTCAEFDRVKQILGIEEMERPRVATAAIIVATLGFRCGLRRNEALFLRQGDLQIDLEPELLIRPHSLRGLKSNSSTRRIPLYPLLEKNELELLKGWLQSSLSEDRNALLFSRTRLSDIPYSAEELFGPIREALQIATGDETLRFHHLRHSCITWLFARLNSNAEELRSRTGFLDHPEFEAERVKQLREMLMDNEGMGRKAAFAIAMLSGHSEPGTSFRNYIHICDFLLGEELFNTSPLQTVNVEHLSGISGIPVPTLYRYRSTEKRSGIESLLVTAIRRSGIKTPESVKTSSEYTSSTLRYEERQLLEARWVTLIKALSLFNVNRLSITEISDKLGYNAETIAGWIDNSRYIAGLKVGTGPEGAYRHRVIASHLKLAGYDHEGRELWESRSTLRKYLRNAQHSSKKRSGHPKLTYIKWIKSEGGLAHPEQFPKPPATKPDRDLLHRIMRAFEGLCKADMEKVVYFCDFFCETFVLNSSGVWYIDPVWAIRHVETIRLLQIPLSRIQLVDHKTEVETVDEITARRKNWESKLGLNRPLWVIADKRLSMKRTSCGISIRVSGEKGSRALYAFRYAMYLIRIGYWE